MLKKAMLICLSALLFVGSMTVGISTAHASSDFDGLIITSSDFTLAGTSRVNSWYDDLREYSADHPSDTALSDAIDDLNDVIYSGDGWSLLMCPDSACGGGGYGQIVLTPPNATYEFFYDIYGRKMFGVPDVDTTLINFRYDSNGMVTAGTNAASAVGIYTRASDYQNYIGFAYYGNTSIISRVVFVNSSVSYPDGYDGWIVPTGGPTAATPYTGTVDCGGVDPVGVNIYQYGNSGPATLTSLSLGRAAWSYNLTSGDYGVQVLCGSEVATSFAQVSPGSTSGDWICYIYDNPRYCVLS